LGRASARWIRSLYYLGFGDIFACTGEEIYRNGPEAKMVTKPYGKWLPNFPWDKDLVSAFLTFADSL